MTIIRAPRPEAHFTMIRNAVLRDPNIGEQARGLLCRILSYPDDWRTDYRKLAGTGKTGEHAIRSALRELREAGYMRQVKRRGESGRWETDNYVYDTPQPKEAQVMTSVENPRSEDRSPEDRRSNEDGHEDSYEDDLTCAPAPRGPADDTPTAGDEDPADWRDLDYKLWCGLLGDPAHLLQGGKPYTLRSCYDAIRRSTKQGARKKWPGRYFEAMDDIEREDWLTDRWGLTLP